MSELARREPEARSLKPEATELLVDLLEQRLHLGVGLELARHLKRAEGRGQRARGALNLNVHVHALVLDGVFAKDGAGALRFHRGPHLTGEEVGAVVATVARRIARLLERRGLARGDEGGAAADRWAAEAPVLAGMAAASVQGLMATGPRPGARVRRCGDPPEAVEPSTLGRCHARQHGFDLHAGLVVPAGSRDRLERVSRYAWRPPLAQDRLWQAPDGQVWLALRHRWADGTTPLHPTAHHTRGGDPGLRFDPLELLERLAVLTLRRCSGSPRAASRGDATAAHQSDPVLRRPGATRQVALGGRRVHLVWRRTRPRGDGDATSG